MSSKDKKGAEPEWEFDEHQARLHLKLLDVLDKPAGYAAELRLIRERPEPTTSHYPATEGEFVDLVRKHGPGSIVTVGVNPRPWGFAGAAKAADVQVITNVFIDIDADHPKDTPATHEQLVRLDAFMSEAFTSWVTTKGIAEPARIHSGNGYQLVFGLPPMALATYPDFVERTRAFRNLLATDLHEALTKAGARIDSTFDPSRVMRVVGTKKPKPGFRVSRFVGEPHRNEDTKLRDLLLAIDPGLAPPSEREPRARVEVMSKDFGEENIPERFWNLLKKYPRLAKAFNYELGAELAEDGKDPSRSGHDLSLVGQLIHLGIVDPKALGAILFNTPHGKAKEKAEEDSDSTRYIARTIAKAFDGAPPGLVPGSGLKDIVGDPDFLNPAQDFRDGVAFFSRKFVEQKTFETKEGETYRRKVMVTKIVTSDRRMLGLQRPPQIKGELVLLEVPGTTYQAAKAVFDGETRWRWESRYGIAAHIHGKSPRVDLRVLFPRLVGAFESYVKLPDADDAVLLAIYTLGSYVYRLFPSYPYLHLNGPKGTGKSTTGRVLSCLGFNASMVTNCSAASMFRTIDNLSPLLVLDETEGMKNRESAAEDPRSDLLKGGYQRGAMVTRQDTNNVTVTHHFDIYCPKVICNIAGLDDILADRAIRIQTQRGDAREADALVRHPLDHTHAHWAGYRDQLYTLAMQRHQEIAAIRDELDGRDFGFKGRDHELWFPLMVLATFVERSRVSGLVKRLLALAERKRADKEAMREEGEEETLVRILLDLASKEPGDKVEISMDAIEPAVNREMGKTMSPNSIGKVMQTIGVPAGRRVKVKDDDDDAGHWTRVYTVSKKKLLEWGSAAPSVAESAPKPTSAKGGKAA